MAKSRSSRASSPVRIGGKSPMRSPRPNHPDSLSRRSRDPHRSARRPLRTSRRTPLPVRPTIPAVHPFIFARVNAREGVPAQPPESRPGGVERCLTNGAVGLLLSPRGLLSARNTREYRFATPQSTGAAGSRVGHYDARDGRRSWRPRGAVRCPLPAPDASAFATRTPTSRALGAHAPNDPSVRRRKNPQPFP